MRQVFLNHLGIGGEQDNLMAHVREIVLEQIIAMVGIEPAKGRVDDHGQRPARGFLESPEDGDDH